LTLSKILTISIEKDVGVAMNYDLYHLLQACQEHHLADGKTLRLFACYCARSVLNNITDKDARNICQNTIEVAERFAHGLATEEELEAAHSAVYSAARSVAWSAAGSAARVAAGSTADYPAVSAAYYAAHFAAYFAAYSAAYSADNSADNSADYAAAKQQYALHLLEMVPRLKKMLVWL
jgi:hypothetical protein